jgi:hypothetical protein
MKQVICRSGLQGWQCRLRENYANFAEFEANSDIYNLAGRLGFRSAKGAWKANPVIQGSVEPSDYQRVRK